MGMNAAPWVLATNGILSLGKECGGRANSDTFWLKFPNEPGWSHSDSPGESPRAAAWGEHPAGMDFAANYQNSSLSTREDQYLLNTNFPSNMENLLPL